MTGRRRASKTEEKGNPPQKGARALSRAFEDKALPNPPGDAGATDKAREIEHKFLIPDGDLSVFPLIKAHFDAKGYARIRHGDQHLLSRQLDTADRRLFAGGTTLRLRGTCTDGNLSRVAPTDICLKTGKTTEESGACARGEYEATVPDFNTVDFKALFAKYPPREFPELRQALKGIREADCREFFRIDCIRSRYVVELPPAVTGLDKNRRAAGELILDDVAYVLDVPEMRKPLVFHHDGEVEFELLFKPCAFDTSPDKALYVSSPLSLDERNQAMTGIRREIAAAAGGRLIDNDRSKAERGFAALDAALCSLQSFIRAASAGTGGKGVLPTVFSLSAEGQAEPRIHRRLPPSCGAVLKRRGIALPDPGSR